MEIECRPCGAAHVDCAAMWTFAAAADNRDCAGTMNGVDLVDRYPLVVSIFVVGRRLRRYHHVRHSAVVCLSRRKIVDGRAQHRIVDYTRDYHRNSVAALRTNFCLIWICVHRVHGQSHRTRCRWCVVVAHKHHRNCTCDPSKCDSFRGHTNRSLVEIGSVRWWCAPIVASPPHIVVACSHPRWLAGVAICCYCSHWNLRRMCRYLDLYHPSHMV